MVEPETNSIPSSKPSDPNSPPPSTAPQKDPKGDRRADELVAQAIANLPRVAREAAARREKEAIKPGQKPS
jgi:hypothetical protein